MGTGGAILVVDDESAHRYLQASALGSWGYNTYETGDGMVALKMIRGNDFFPSRQEKRLSTLRKIMHQGMARLAFKWPYLSDRLTRSFAPLEFEEIPWAEVSKPLNQSKIAVVTTAGLHHRSQENFDMGDPHGDPSFRVLDTVTIEQDYRITHDYYDHRDAERDLNVVFPVTRLKEMQESGFVGALAEWHFSLMGHIEGPHIDALVGETAPRVAAMLNQDRVEVVLLTPG
jgi:D-proline reductase (dithiol) PrdB